MKAAELKKMTDEELVKKESDLREEFGNLSFQHKIRPLEDTSKLKQVRKDIARILTISRERAAN